MQKATSTRSKAGEKPQGLRERAEAAWRSSHSDSPTIAPENTVALLHELEVHQIELEMQNEELRRAQAELEEARNHLLSLYDFAPVGYLTLGQDAVMLQTNLKAAEMMGTGRSLLIGKPFTNFLARESRRSFFAYWRALNSGVQPEGCELRLSRADGTEVPISMVTVYAKGSGGETLWRCTITDDTRRLRAEQALRQADRQKDEFLAVLGHELRNPLAAVSTALQILSGGVSPEQSSELRDIAVQQVVLMRRLLDDLLDIARITHNHIELKKEAIELKGFLEKAVTAVQPVVSERGQKLSISLPSDPVKFMADPIRLQQIVANLLSNASKYTPRGGAIELSGNCDGFEVVVRCRDNGQGIPPEQLGKIFEPFTRAMTDNDYGEASLGIGLTLAKHLVNLHGGTITAASAGTGMGSEFTVRLPLVAPPAEASPARPQPAPVSPRKRTIVLVEDNPNVARTMKIALKGLGNRVHLFSDAPSVLSAVAGLKPDAVVLDIGLPGMNGYELAARLKRHHHLHDAMFIAISGLKPLEQSEEIPGVFDAYLIKPVEVAALQALLEKCAETPQEERSKPGESEPLRVLLIEDHPGVAATTAALLRQEGLDVRTAVTGREALNVAPEFRPRLVLCDRNLGDMKGPEVIRKLRAMRSTPKMHAVILSAISKEDLRIYNREAAKQGVDEYLSKPITPAAIRTLVSKIRHDDRKPMVAEVGVEPTRSVKNARF